MALTSEQMKMRLGWKRPDAPDERDFSMAKALEIYKPPDDQLADLTIRQAYDAGYFASWKGILAFWHWIKVFFHISPPDPPPVKRKKTWFDPEQLDQGMTPHCVAFASTHYLNTDPVYDHLNNDYAHALYYEMKIVDGEEGEENGTTLHSAAKVLKAKGRINTYIWARTGQDGIKDIKAWILDHGSVFVGTDWLLDMEFPDENGVISVSGDWEGGHGYLLLGYDEETDLFEGQNSWGEEWGVKGHFFVKASEFVKLLDGTSEACATTELPLSAFA